GKVFDASEAGNDGRLIGDAKILNSGETSQISDDSRGHYLVVDGDGDYVEIPNHDSLQLDSQATVSAWVRPEEFISLSGIVSKWALNNPSWNLRLWSGSSKKLVRFGDRSHDAVSKNELREKRWTHVVATFDKEERMVRIYVNGRLDAEHERLSGSLQVNSAPVQIGNDFDKRFFDGAIDDVRIYRRALSRKEVADLYSLESGN
ncbi:MAG: LamG domain-containing protein, partial [Verrucomicrobiota bacterium]